MTETPPDHLDPDENQPDLSVLVRTAHRVTDQIESLQRTLAEATTKSKQEIAAERRARRRSIWLTTGVVVIDIALSVASLILYIGQRQTNQKLAESLRENYTTSQQQAQTRVRVLCPLYTLLLASVDTSKRNALPPTQQAVYDHTVKVIRDGYNALGCTPALSAVIPPTR